MTTLCACGATALYLAYVGGRKVGYCKAHRRAAEQAQRRGAMTRDREMTEYDLDQERIDRAQVAKLRFRG